MNDLTMTELCAQAMGVSLMGSDVPLWNPLKDDAQAMALVKKFGLQISHQYHDWGAMRITYDGDKLIGSEQSISPDLNRAIVRCIAQMQLDRTARETSTVAQDK